jgi:hypothetical protein
MDNTKLPYSMTKDEARQHIRSIRGTLVKSEFLQYPEIGLTIFVATPFKGSNNLTFSIAQMSPNETKFRKLVGKYFAVEHFEDGRCVSISRDTFGRFLDSISRFDLV